MGKTSSECKCRDWVLDLCLALGDGIACGWCRKGKRTEERMTYLGETKGSPHLPGDLFTRLPSQTISSSLWSPPSALIPLASFALPLPFSVSRPHSSRRAERLSLSQSDW